GARGSSVRGVAPPPRPSLTRGEGVKETPDWHRHRPRGSGPLPACGGGLGWGGRVDPAGTVFHATRAPPVARAVAKSSRGLQAGSVPRARPERAHAGVDQAPRSEPP